MVVSVASSRQPLLRGAASDLRSGFLSVEELLQMPARHAADPIAAQLPAKQARRPLVRPLVSTVQSPVRDSQGADGLLPGDTATRNRVQTFVPGDPRLHTLLLFDRLRHMQLRVPQQTVGRHSKTPAPFPR